MDSNKKSSRENNEKVGVVKKMKISGRKIVSFVAVIVMLTSFAGLIAAQTSPNFQFIRIEVNDLEVFPSGIQNLDVERGETLDIEVTLQGTNFTAPAGPNEIDDVRVEAKIVGYEFGPVSDITPVFSVESGLTYQKTLHIEIPEDIDASERYILRIEISDRTNEIQEEFELNIDEQRHSLSFVPNGGILLNPSSTIGAGKPLFVTVRLENLGEKVEEDIKITARIPELGVQAVNFLDELVTEIDEETERFSFEEESSGQVDLLVRIPEDAESGTYTLEVEADYNRGHSKLVETRQINVVGIPQDQEVDTIVNPVSTTQNVKVGQEATYRISIANIGEEKGIYAVSIDGTDPWAEARVEPGFLTVLPDSTGEVLIIVKPTEDAESRNYVFLARVMLGNQVLNEITFHANVKDDQVTEPATAGAPATFKTVLAIIFAVLVVILIVLGIVLGVQKSKETEQEAPAAETQTYYFSPRK